MKNETKKLSPAAIDEIADVLANLMIRAAKEQIEKRKTKQKKK